jgi:hypothetical protein
MREADPVFDFAQGRLFGMITRKARAKAKAKGKSQCLWRVDGLHPTLLAETAKDGAPVRLWLAEMGLRRQEIPFDSLVGFGP